MLQSCAFLPALVNTQLQSLPSPTSRAADASCLHQCLANLASPSSRLSHSRSPYVAQRLYGFLFFLLHDRFLASLPLCLLSVSSLSFPSYIVSFISSSTSRPVLYKLSFIFLLSYSHVCSLSSTYFFSILSFAASFPVPLLYVSFTSCPLYRLCKLSSKSSSLHLLHSL